MTYNNNAMIPLLDRLGKDLNLVVFDLTSVDANVFSLMGHWKKAAQKQGWAKEDIESVLYECTTSDYDHAVQTLISVSTEEAAEDEDDDDYYEDEDDRPYSHHKRFRDDY